MAARSTYLEEIAVANMRRLLSDVELGTNSVELTGLGPTARSARMRSELGALSHFVENERVVHLSVGTEVGTGERESRLVDRELDSLVLGKNSVSLFVPTNARKPPGRFRSPKESDALEQRRNSLHDGGKPPRPARGHVGCSEAQPRRDDGPSTICRSRQVSLECNRDVKCL